MSLINKEDLMLTLGITDMDCEKCGWYSKAARRCKRGSDFEDACCAIEDAPEVLPEPKWIPVSERLPEEKDAGILKKLGTEKRSDYVIATVEVKGERMTVTACTYDGAWDWNMKYAFPDYKIIAWMPLPEPYREEGDE